jgi:hypothetical protein
MVTRMRLITTLYIHCLSCYKHNINIFHTLTPRVTKFSKVHLANGRRPLNGPRPTCCVPLVQGMVIESHPPCSLIQGVSFLTLSWAP